MSYKGPPPASFGSASQPRPLRADDGPRGQVFVLRSDTVSTEDRDLLQTAARALLLSRHGTLSEQVMRMEAADTPGGRARLPGRR
jgi:hypothetical protein